MAHDARRAWKLSTRQMRAAFVPLGMAGGDGSKPTLLIHRGLNDLEGPTPRTEIFTDFLTWFSVAYVWLPVLYI